MIKNGAGEGKGASSGSRHTSAVLPSTTASNHRPQRCAVLLVLESTHVGVYVANVQVGGKRVTIVMHPAATNVTTTKPIAVTITVTITFAAAAVIAWARQTGGQRSRDGGG